MKILSIDIGIKNLAFCLFEVMDTNTMNILAWDIINLSVENVIKCSHIECTNIAKFINKDTIETMDSELNNGFCLKHAKTSGKKKPKKEQTMIFLQKQPILFLKAEAQKYSLPMDKKELKGSLLKKMEEYLSLHYLVPLPSSPNCKDISLIQIGKHIQKAFNTLFLPFETIEYVIIENQVSPIASRMKTIQGMVAQYFIMSSLHVSNIEFISAANKLTLLKDVKKDEDVKDVKKDKTTYKERKLQGILLCKSYLTLDLEHLAYFEKHKKKDDLADAYLQGIWFHLHKFAPLKI